MTRLSVTISSVMILLPLFLAADCVVVDGERITAGDIARVQPEFAALAPDTPLAFAPRFGVRRELAASELSRWARSAHLRIAEPQRVCLERHGRVWTASDIRAALPVPADWRVELLGDQYAGRPAPAGRLEFALSSLPREAPFAIVIWKGRIVDPEQNTHPFWIRVRLTAERSTLRARIALRPGELLAEAHAEATVLRRYAVGEESPIDAKAWVGRRLRRAIAAGHPIRPADLVEPRAIERGDLVEVRMDEAVLRVEAESPGRTGERVLLKNPLTGKRFSARVTGPRAAILSETKTP